MSYIAIALSTVFWNMLISAVQGKQDGLKSNGAYQDGQKSNGAYQDGLKSNGAYQDGLKSSGTYQDGLKSSGTYKLLLWGAFAKYRKATGSFVISVRPHGTPRLLLDGFWRNLIFKPFLKICHITGHSCKEIENTNFVFSNFSLSKIVTFMR